MEATTSITASIVTPGTATLGAILRRMISPIGTGTAEAAVSGVGRRAIGTPRPDSAVADVGATTASGTADQLTF
jgi:hypothetical protein